jgi:hypothetical protein
MRQQVCGIFCMVMIANLQYGWTPVVHPIDQKFHWGTTAILCLCGGFEFDRRCTRTFRSQANAAANYELVSDLGISRSIVACAARIGKTRTRILCTNSIGIRT